MGPVVTRDREKVAFLIVLVPVQVSLSLSARLKNLLEGERDLHPASAAFTFTND